MTEYECTVPVIGTCYVTVEAEDPKAAISAAVNAACERLESEGIQALETCEAMDIISAGNIWLAEAPAATSVEADGETTEADFGGWS